MIANKENRASLAQRLIFALSVAGFFTLFFDSLDYFVNHEPFDFWISIASFLLLAVILFITSYYFMTKKAKQ